MGLLRYIIRLVEYIVQSSQTTQFLLHSVESEEWRKIGGEVAYLLLFSNWPRIYSIHLLLH